MQLCLTAGLRRDLCRPSKDAFYASPYFDRGSGTRQYMSASHRSIIADMGTAKNIGPLKSLPGNANLVGVHLPSSFGY
jgi:hypothetical protein